MHFPHFLLDHLRWGFVANERVGATKAIPEVVNLVRLLADERGGGRRAFALLQTFGEGQSSPGQFQLGSHNERLSTTQKN